MPLSSPVSLGRHPSNTSLSPPLPATFHASLLSCLSSSASQQHLSVSPPRQKVTTLASLLSGLSSSTSHFLPQNCSHKAPIFCPLLPHSNHAARDTSLSPPSSDSPCLSAPRPLFAGVALTELLLDSGRCGWQHIMAGSNRGAFYMVGSFDGHQLDANFQLHMEAKNAPFMCLASDLYLCKAKGNFV